MSEQIPLEPGIIEGLTKVTIDKLVAAGIPTVQVLATQTPKILAEKSGLGQDTVEKAIRKAVQLTSDGFITGIQLRDKRKERTRLKTGSEALDTLIGGGIESETTTEISGAGGVAKTQICMTLAVLAQLPMEQGGLNGEVAIIDSEDTTRPERLVEIAKARGLDSDKILNGIHWAFATNTAHQKLLIEQLFDLCTKHPIKLVIIDSMIGHLRSEYIGRGNLSDRQGELGSMLQTLLKVALSTKVTVVYTNQVMDRPIAYGNPEVPTGGTIMAHAGGTRLHLRKGRENKRIAKLIDSLSLPEGEAAFVVCEKGIDDTPEYKKMKEKEEPEYGPTVHDLEGFEEEEKKDE